MISPGRARAAALSEGSELRVFPGLIPLLPGRGEQREGNRAGTKAARRLPQQPRAVPRQPSPFPACATFPSASSRWDSQTTSLCEYGNPVLWLSNGDQSFCWIASNPEWQAWEKHCAKPWCLTRAKKNKYICVCIIYNKFYIYKLKCTGILRRQVPELSR